MPGMTFHINSPLGAGTTFGTGSVASVRGERGLGYFRLNMTLDFVIEPAGSSVGQSDLPQLTELMTEARIGGRSIGRFIPMVPGYLPVRSYPQRSNRASIPLTCELDRARVEAIEGARAGGHLALDISVNGRFGNGEAFSGSEPYVVNQGVWIEALADMGYQRTLLVEVPMPDPNAQPELADAVALLAEAQGHLQLGHDRDAVGSLRDVLEQVKLAFGDDDTIDRDLNRALFDGSRSMTKGERLRVLRRALMLVTHPARHRDQVSVAIDWSRIDATQMITMTAAFVNEMSAPDARPPQRNATPGQPISSAAQPNEEEFGGPASGTEPPNNP
jgi:hypothetical protein